VLVAHGASLEAVDKVRTHACALGHVLYEGCVCDYEEHEDVDYLCVCM
jgi:hypothetical protein